MSDETKPETPADDSFYIGVEKMDVITLPPEEQARDGPFTLQAMIVLACNEDPDKTAVCVLSLPPGRILTFPEFQAYVDKTIATANEGGKDKGLTFKLMPRHKFIAELRGLPKDIPFTIPGPDMFTLDKTDGAA